MCTLLNKFSTSKTKNEIVLVLKSIKQFLTDLIFGQARGFFKGGFQSSERATTR